ncbi:hypothetical protein EVG20_g8640 [Dentipellis fragilis]|uniref:F-box domain-containing protein n=1 Tax=Dentipellis fragilis TaxID=205917 RepID=A0A4Y9Y6X2_9AGAM|nr:hypothetical protein EVG20_g8640 [Dentipellis fragilis]
MDGAANVSLSQLGPCYIATLPAELLSNILSSLTTTSSGSKSFHHSTYPIQVPLSHVCRHWRSILLQMPTLWSTLSIILNNFCSDRLQTFIERSGQQSLDIVIRAGQKDFDSMQTLYATYEHILAMLTPHVERWSSFDFCTPADTWWTLEGDVFEDLTDIVFAELADLSAPCLRKFAHVPLSIGAEIPSGTVQQQWRNRRDKPRTPFRGDLSRLTVLQFRHDLTTDPEVLLSCCTFADLQSLDLDTPHLKDIDPSCFNLVSLRLKTVSNPLLAADGHGRVVAPNLHSSVFISFLLPPNQLFESIIAPQLRCLVLRLEATLFSHLGGTLTSRQETSGQSRLHLLTALWIRPSGDLLEASGLSRELHALRVLIMDVDMPISVPTGMWVPVLRMNPMLEQLFYLLRPYSDDDTQQDHPIAPLLTTLILITEGSDIVMVKETLIARRAAGMPLQKLFVDDIETLGGEDLAWFCNNLEAFGRIPSNWEELPEIRYMDECVAIEAEAAGTKEFEELCSRLEWTLYRPTDVVSICLRTTAWFWTLGLIARARFIDEG